MKKMIAGTLVVSTLIQAASVPAFAKKSKTAEGAVIGGIIGGVIGAVAGGKDDRAEGALIGIIAGAIIGGAVGSTMDDGDRRAYGDAQRRSLNGGLNRSERWEGRQYGGRSGAYGDFTCVREGYHVRSNRVCREYRSVIWASNGRKETQTGYACSNPDGSWYEVRTKEISWGGRNDLPQYPGPSRPLPPHDEPQYPQYPQYPQPPREPNYPQPPRHDDDDYRGDDSLRGRCRDTDHRQFYVAKDFAYATNGLNYNSNQATQWALDYNETHACGTINEYAARYRSLYNFAYATNGLNYNSNQAREYALERVERQTSQETSQFQQKYQAIYNFAYATNGLNLNSNQAREIGLQWVNGRCEGVQGINRLASDYRREYDFAYSTRGLNMNSNQARRYAVDKISRQTRCGHILQRGI